MKLPKRPTRGPEATKKIFGEIIKALEDLDDEDEEIWEELEKLKKGVRKTFIVLENGKLINYRWRAEFIGPVPDV